VAVTLRLARAGLPGRPHYRIVAADKVKPRDGRFIEVLGTYTPRNPPSVTFKEERVKHWLQHGAVASSVVRDLIRKKIPGLIEAREKNKLEKLQASRRARKARAKKRAK
jgi:small subunit ribosomal protein S16